MNRTIRSRSVVQEAITRGGRSERRVHEGGSRQRLAQEHEDSRERHGFLTATVRTLGSCEHTEKAVPNGPKKAPTEAQKAPKTKTKHAPEGGMFHTLNRA